MEADLLVLGAGAKGAAIAMKSHAVNAVGLGPVAVSIVEAVGPAAAWRDGEGVTSSREVLGLGPSKDVGFPYQGEHAFGEHGGAVDRAALEFSWQSYLVEKGRYAEWIDAGGPAVQRRVFGDYLGWVLARSRNGVTIVRGRVVSVGLTRERERWMVDVADRDGSSRVTCGALALTGQGAPRRIAHDAGAASRVLDCESGRMQIARVTEEQSSDIAIVGGGESALSCMEFVRARRPDARLTIYTASMPMSRVESFLENRVFSRPDEVDWTALSVSARRDFIARSDRGGFGADRVAPFGFDPGCRFVAGRVTHVSAGADRGRVCVACTSAAGTMRDEHDYVINCTGYDPLEQLRLLLTPDARVEVERQVGSLWHGAIDVDATPIGRSLELRGMHPRVHLPGLAALSQGPGFSTLGALGLVGDRVLEPLVRAATKSSRREPLALGA